MYAVEISAYSFEEIVISWGIVSEHNDLITAIQAFQGAISGYDPSISDIYWKKRLVRLNITKPLDYDERRNFSKAYSRGNICISKKWGV